MKTNLEVAPNDSGHLRLVAVLRISTPGQKNRHGKERQERFEINSYAEELGVSILDTWAIQERATVFDRPHFEACLLRAIELCKAGEIDGLILGSVDRLSRDPYDGGAVCRDALRNGLKLLFAAERLDASKEGDQEKIIGALQAARAYVNRLKRQTIPARRARADEGKIPNGQKTWPFDYNPNTGKATPNPVRAVWVKKWVEILTGGGTVGQCCRLMEDTGIPAPKGGVKWSRSTITRILSSPELKGEFYAGYYRMVAPSFYEKSVPLKSTPTLVYTDKENAILTDDEWTSIQKMLDDNRALSRRNTKRDYTPLQGFVWCHCGRKAAGYPLHRYPYFRCNVCKKPRANARKLWAEVKAGLAYLLSNPDRLIPNLNEILDDESTQEDIRGNIQARENEVQELDEALVRAGRSHIYLPGFTEEMAKREMDRILDRKAKVEVELDDLRDTLDHLTEVRISTDRVEAISQRFHLMLDDATDQEWQGLLREFGVKVVLQPDSRHRIRTRIELTPEERFVLQPS